MTRLWVFTRACAAGMFVVCVAAASAVADPLSDARAVDEAFAKAVKSHDASAVAAIYADDAQVIFPGEGEEAQGKAEIEKLLDGYMKDSKALDVVFTDIKAIPIDASHTLIINHWNFTITDLKGKQTTTKGHSTELIVMGSDGRWRYLVDHASVGLPPPPAPKAKKAQTLQ